MKKRTVRQRNPHFDKGGVWARRFKDKGKAFKELNEIIKRESKHDRLICPNGPNPVPK